MPELFNLPDLFFDEEKLAIIKNNLETIQEKLSPNELKSFLSALESDLYKINEAIEKISSFNHED